MGTSSERSLRTALSVVETLRKSRGNSRLVTTWIWTLCYLLCDNVLVASLVAQIVKNLPALWETWVWSLGWEIPLEQSMANHSSILPWRIPWTEEPGGLKSMGLQRVRYNWATKHSGESLFVHETFPDLSIPWRLGSSSVLHCHTLDGPLS